MSQMKADRPHTLISAGAIAARFRACKISADYTVDLCGAGDPIAGVNLETASAAGQGVAVAGPGSGVSVKVEAGAAIAAGAVLMAAASGRVITATGGSKYYMRALQAAALLGDIIEVQWESGTA